MPACLIEYGFISNANQEKVIHANTSRYGADLYRAIVSYMQLKGRIQ
jgi:N-acetylmuramoyl-L-alanine amidase